MTGHRRQAGSRCTIEMRSGHFCNNPAAALIRYPLCARHARHVFEDMLAAHALEADSPYHRLTVALGWEFPHPAPVGTYAQVYYLLIDGLVKIGRTTNLKNRLKGYPPTAHLLATEPGGKLLEAERLAEFREYRRAGREWFDPGPRLRAHIEALSDYKEAASCL